MPDSTNPPEDRYLAVDYGTKRIGLAVGTARDRIAMRLTTLVNPGKGGEEMVRKVADIVHEEGATHLLVGLPLNMDGTAGAAAKSARAFGDRLARATGLPVSYVDERLSSEAALDLARNASGGRRVRKPIDDLAAAILLQGWFDEEDARRARRSWGEP